MTETEKSGLTALAGVACLPPPPLGLRPGGGQSGRPTAQANIQLELPELDAENLPEWAEAFAEFLLLTGQSHVDVATECSLLKRSCRKRFLQKQVKQIVKTCSTWPMGLTSVYAHRLRSYLSSLNSLPLRESLNMCASWSICFHERMWVPIGPQCPSCGS